MYQHQQKNNIYIVTHKAFNSPKIEGYVPIEVGTELHDKKLGFIRDNQGDNISLKNPNYCELTALYWIWKNDDSEMVGLCHYRRYFSKYLFDTSPKYYLSMKQVNKILDRYDIILPMRFFWLKHTVATGYYDAGQGKKKDLEILKDVISEKYPSYSKDLHEILESHRASYCNMMICSKKLLNEYCMWLFDILFEVEKKVDITSYSVAEARVFGYISEILINVWVKNRNLKVKYIPVAVDKPLTPKRKPLAYVEKIPLLGMISKVLLCMDLNYI